MPINRVVTKKRASLLAAAVALAGGIAATQPAAAATSASAGAASSCNPKTDYEYNSGLGSWSNWCGTGYFYYTYVFEVRDATAPYHRIWIHNADGGAWCAWGPNDTKVPWNFDGQNGIDIENILVSANTSSC